MASRDSVSTPRASAVRFVSTPTTGGGFNGTRQAALSNEFRENPPFPQKFGGRSAFAPPIVTDVLSPLDTEAVLDTQQK